jgi:putative ABC transport system permease protein
LAAVGIYGVISYSVVQRTGEIGIRMALGSNRSTTFLLVVRQTLVYAALGGVAGLVGSYFVGRLVRGLLYEVSPLDPLAVTITALVLVVTAAVAASVPALRATAVDPASALSGE